MPNAESHEMQSQFPGETLDRIQRAGVIAVLVIDRVEHGPPLAEALLAGGVDAMELTLRTPAAIDALRAVRQEAPKMLAGIGTILTPAQVDRAFEAGAAFGVAPGLNRRVVQRAQVLGLPFAPGVATPSEVEAAIELGCRELKFFPAEPSGGISYLSSMLAPYAHLGPRFIPLGGLNADNMGAYLANPAIPAIGGSWIAPRKLILDEDWSAITRNAREARSKIENLRGGKGG